MYKQVHSKGVSIINGPYRVKTRITYSIYAIRLSMAHNGGRALFVKTLEGVKLKPHERPYNAI